MKWWLQASPEVSTNPPWKMGSFFVEEVFNSGLRSRQKAFFGGCSGCRMKHDELSRSMQLPN